MKQPVASECRATPGVARRNIVMRNQHQGNVYYAFTAFTGILALHALRGDEVCRERAVVVVKMKGQGSAVPGCTAERLAVGRVDQGGVNQFSLQLKIDAKVHLAGLALDSSVPQANRRLRVCLG